MARSPTADRIYSLVVKIEKHENTTENDDSGNNENLQIETGERPYICHIFNRKFGHMGKQTRHDRTHTEAEYAAFVPERFKYPSP